MQKETVVIDERFGKEYAGTYIFKEITWAKRSRIIQKHTKYHSVTGQVISSDYIAIQAETIWASLKKQPRRKPINLQKLLSETDGIPIGLGEQFSRVANKLCSIGRQDVRFLLEQLDEESRTQLFLTFGYVKNSAGPQKSSVSSQQRQ